MVSPSFTPGGRQAEEDEEQLHDERRVADQFDIGGDHAAEPFRPEGARRGAGDADRDAGHGRDHREHDGEEQPLQQHVPVGQQVAELEFVDHGGCGPALTRQKPGGSGAFSHFSDSLAISPEALACAMISLTLASSFGSSLLRPMKQGLSLMTNFSVGARAGTFSAMAAATVLPVAIRSTWPETNAAMVALLSSKRLMVASGGAELGQLLLLDGAAGGADRLAVEVGRRSPP